MVKFLPLLNKVSYILASLIKSKLLVASSKIKNLLFLTKALAKANLCFSPPESPPPASSKKVSYFAGSLSIKELQLAFSQAVFISS
ncbi:hypothetical protein D3C76_1440940 [compost metagenome]